MLHITPFFHAYSTVIAFLLGTVLASFLGCLGWRMCHGESVLKGRSHCDSCGHVLKGRDLIPVLSYLMSKGHCRYCGVRISPVNLYGEVIVGVLFALFTYLQGNPFILVLDLFFICILYLVTVTDLYEQIIPDGAILTAIVAKVVHTILEYVNAVEQTSFGWKLVNLLIDGLAVSLPLLILVLIMEKILGKEAMGGGDIKLLFVTGLYLGWMRNILVIFVACIVGIVVGMIQQKNMQDVKDEEEEQSFYFAFGPSIAVATVFVMLFGNQILNWYLSLF